MSNKTDGIFRVKIMAIRIIILITGGLISVLLAGCKSSPLADPTSTFAAAVTQVQTNTSAVTALLMSSDMTLQIQRAAQGTMLKEGSFQTFDTEAGKISRTLALQALADYAMALETLANSDNGSNLQTAASGLQGDLDTITNSITSVFKGDPTQTAQITGVCDAIFQLGVTVESAILSRERDKALQNVLATNQAAVDVICGKFSAEMDPGSRFINFQSQPVFYDELEHQFRIQEETLESSFTNAVAKGDSTNRLAIATQFGQLLQKKDLTLGLCRAIGQAFERLDDVHAALLKTSEQKGTPQAALDALSMQTKTVIVYSQQLQTIGDK